MDVRLNKFLLLSLMLVGFLDICNFFMPIPIYAPFFLHEQFLGGGIDQHSRYMMLGIALASYGFAQLFGGPLFGEASDQYGRKAALLFALSLSVLGCLLGAISMTMHWVYLLYISRLVLGFASGTIAIVLAVTADYSHVSERAKNIGYINIGLALGVILGPVIGGHLVSSTSFSFFGYATPFYAMAIIYTISIFLILYLLPNEPALREKSKFNFFVSFKNLYVAIGYSKNLCSLVFIVLFFQIGAEAFYLAAPILAVKYLNMSPATIGNFFMMQGIGAAIILFVFNKYLSSNFSSRKIFTCATFLVFVFMLFLPEAKSNSMLFYLPFIGLGLCGTLSWTHSNAMFSQSVDKTKQGLIFGVSQSLWSLGGILGALLVGIFSPAVSINSAFVPLFFIGLSILGTLFFLKSPSTS